MKLHVTQFHPKSLKSNNGRIVEYYPCKKGDYLSLDRNNEPRVSVFSIDDCGYLEFIKYIEFTGFNNT